MFNDDNLSQRIRQTLDDERQVHTRKPDSSEGSDGDVRWVFLEGDGLYQAKKHSGKWHYLFAGKEDASDGTIQSSGSSGGGGTTSATDGVFDTLSVSNTSSLGGTTTISGSTFNVTTTNLNNFDPRTGNLKITSGKLDTIQDIKTTDSPTFANLTITNNAEIANIWAISTQSYFNYIGKLSQATYTNATGGSNLTDGLGIFDSPALTKGEVDQIKNIDSETISNTQWSYLGALDQHIKQDADVIHKSIALKDYDNSSSQNKIWKIKVQDETALTGTASGDLNIYVNGDGQVDSAIVFGSASQDDNTLRNNGYVSGLFGDGWAIYEDENRHKAEFDDLIVRGTLSVYELLIQQVRATNGSLYVSSAAKVKPSGLMNIGSISGLSNVSAGSGLTNGTYNGVSLSGGAGTGVQCTIVVAGGAITSTTLTANGSGYVITDVVSVPPNTFGNPKVLNYTITGLQSLDGSNYVLEFDTDSGNNKFHPFGTNDLILQKSVDPDGQNVASESRFTVVDYNYGSSSQAKVTNQLYSGLGSLPNASPWYAIALDGTTFARVGNTTDTDRQGGLYLTSDDSHAPFLDVFDSVSSWEEFDGITGAFDFAQGDFDSCSAFSNHTSNGQIGTNAWYFIGASGGNATLETSGGLTNDKHLKLNSVGNSGGAFAYQTIKIPYIASGTMEFTIEFYYKGANNPLIGLSDEKVGDTSNKKYGTAGSISTGADATPCIAVTSITSPNTNPSVSSTLWRRFRWTINVASTDGIWSGSNPATMYLTLGTAQSAGSISYWDNVRIWQEGKNKIRLGKLEGVGKPGYGLVAENVYLDGHINASTGFIGDVNQGWSINSNTLSNASNNSAITVGTAPTYNATNNTGVFIGGGGRLSLGDSDVNGLSWDGSGTLTVRGTVHIGAGGSIHESLLNVPSLFKIKSRGPHQSGNFDVSNIGIFAEGGDYAYSSRPSGFDTPGATNDTLVAHWDVSANTWGNFETDGENSYTTATNGNQSSLALAVANIPDGDIVIIVGYGDAVHNWQSVANSTWLNMLKRCGATQTGIDSASGESPYILIGRKQSAAHSGGTEMFLRETSDEVIYATISLQGDAINILDDSGQLEDFDVDTYSTFSYFRNDGYKIKTYDYSDTTDRNRLTFVMPPVDEYDKGHLQLVITHTKWNYHADIDGKIKLNNYTLETGVQPNDTNKHQLVYEGIAHANWYDSANNVIKFVTDNNYASDTMYIYRVELRDARTGMVYHNASSDFELHNNLFKNPSFEEFTGDVPTDWTLNVESSGVSDQISQADGYVKDGTHSVKLWSTSGTGSSPSLQTQINVPRDKTYLLRWYARRSNWTSHNSTVAIHADDAEVNNDPRFLACSSSNGAHTYSFVDTESQFIHAWQFVQGATGYSDLPTNEWIRFQAEIEWLSGAAYHASPVWTFRWFIGDGNSTSFPLYMDHMQFINKTEVDSSVSDGLYMTGEKMGFYNGTGGDAGWVNYMNSAGEFFLGDPYSAANFGSPNSGGSYIRYTSSLGSLDINANMIAGLITSRDGKTRFALDDNYIEVKDDSNVQRVLLGKLS
tara:strand:- start:4863 stop:9518 length:4656 start_codon:yes stop_codon:yes gene_type:complete